MTTGRALYFQGAQGPLLGVLHPAAGGRPRGHILHLPAFAEEANACRRLVSQAARALSDAGWSVLLFDLRGTGDSGGQFKEATWSGWTDDARAALNTLLHDRAPTNDTPVWLWGARGGVALALELLAAPQSLPTALCNLLAWQPLWSGQQVLQQWQRVDAARSWLHAPSPASDRIPVDDDAAITWVGGYPLSGGLKAGLLASAPKPVPPVGRLVWLDTLPTADATDPPLGTQRQLARWTAQGGPAAWRGLAGPSYWASVSTANHPALITATAQALQDTPDASPPG